MTNNKAKWPISERAADIEKAKGYQKSNAKTQDDRQQTDSKPCDNDNCK